MAELVLSPLIELLVAKIADAGVKKLARYAGIHSEVKKWETSLSDIQALLTDASQKEITSESIKGWLNRLQHLAYDIDDVLDVLATEAMKRDLAEQSGSITGKVRKLIPPCCTSFSVSIRMPDKLDNITTRLQDLEKEKFSLGLNVINERPRKMKRSYETGLPDECGIVGREGEKDALLNKLLGEGGEPSNNQKFNIVPIVGMGGMGKTTLARILFNETKVQSHFEMKAWVCVSDEFDIFKISKSILSQISENKEITDLHVLQVALREQLMEKRFLLVLDDVWSESDEDWDKLVRPFYAGSPGSKILMTTRKEQLLKKLGYGHLNPLQKLSDGDALSLFSRHVSGVTNFDSHLRKYGEEIVKKCDGLPLALKALARLLNTKTEEEEWKQLLNSEVWSLQKGDGVVPALKLSYHDLNASLKQLFAYCSLFPKDYLFDKEELVQLWMAEGFLQPSVTSNLGSECFEELLSRSFFQRAPNEESLFVMHDLMNDLAMSVAGDFFLRSDNEVQKVVRNDVLEKYRHISFVCDRFMVYEKFEAFKGAKNSRTFLALRVGMKKRWDKFYVSDKILGDLIHEFPLLRVLCLSYLQISEVPESIGSLKHLRYLNLSRSRITQLPENVGNLYNLQTLIVFGCHRLSKLPKSFLKLKNLQHFEAWDTPLLNKMPLGIGELKNLQTLSKIIIGGDNGIATTEFKELKNLQGEMLIEGLEKVENAKRAQELNLSQKRISVLGLKWSNVVGGFQEGKELREEEVFDVLKPSNADLRKLAAESYGGIKFPNWFGDATFQWLTHVAIVGCIKCTSLPPLEQLPSLKDLYIEGMHGVNSVGCGSGVAFASLEILHFKDMQGWEVWSSNSGVGDVVFPCLKKLHIINCPKLVEVSIGTLPSLSFLQIDGCGHGVLRSLVHVASSVIILVVRGILGLTDVFWRGVIGYLGAVEEVVIDRCDEIRYLWESEAEVCKVLKNLRSLMVRRCSKFVRLGEKEEDNCGSNLTNLRMLEVESCENIEGLSCPNCIETLDIYDCSSMTSVSFPSGHKFKLLHIRDCEKLLEKDFLINEGKPMLEHVYISNWSNLKSIIRLSCFIHLTSLSIENCPSMESFADHELRFLTSLKRMRIKRCPKMDASFPGGHWPPNLCELEIGGLKKPIVEWGPQNFPTSLVTLSLVGGSSEDVTNFSQLSHLLPSSLTTLNIDKFEKLESISEGLQHLTFLQHLWIRDCPTMKHLPQMLFPKLLGLWITACPNLKERCSKGGFYWNLISHIPLITIDGDGY